MEDSNFKMALANALALRSFHLDEYNTAGADVQRRCDDICDQSIWPGPNIGTVKEGRESRKATCWC